jgi:hypothetical protein
MMMMMKPMLKDYRQERWMISKVRHNNTGSGNLEGRRQEEEEEEN